LAAALTEAGEAAERAADAAAADAAATLTRSLKTQAAELKRAAAECLLRERIQRMEALDETRVAVNALTETLAVNSANLEASHKTLRLHVAVDALAEAAARGAATAEPVAALRACCAGGGAEGDAGVAFVEAVTATLVTRKDEDEGTPTIASLTNRLEDVTRAARRLALVPKTSGGVLTHVVSFLASTLRAKESVTSEVSSSDDALSSSGVEAALATATHAMAAGRLAEAAAALEGGVKGSAAEALCAGWVKDARERQRLEMAVAALRAHAAAETATVA
jgi:mitofilin